MFRGLMVCVSLVCVDSAQIGPSNTVIFGGGALGAGTLTGSGQLDFNPGLQQQGGVKKYCGFADKPLSAAVTIQGELTARQLVMTASSNSLTRGFFIKDDETNMMEKRREAIEVINTIELSSSPIAESFFSKDFEEKSSSENFHQTVTDLGKKIAVDGNAHYLFVSAQASHSVAYDKKYAKTKDTTTSRNFFSHIKMHTIPTKSVDLDPCYIRLIQEVLDQLKIIDNNNIGREEQKRLFINFFDTYGSHFLSGTMVFGGILISTGHTSIEGSSDNDKLKDTVRKATDTHLEVSASFGEGGGGVSGSTSAHHYKDNLSSDLDDHTLKEITLEFTKKGGPAATNNIDRWMKGLREQMSSWTIIDKSTELISVWELIQLHHEDQFRDAKDFASRMKGAWQYATGHQIMLELAAEFGSLDISSGIKLRKLVSEMLLHGKLGAHKDSRYAHIEVIQGGHVVMSALQEEPLDPRTTILSFEKLKFALEVPNMVYLKLEHKDLYLGHVIIALEGDKEFPNRVKQMLELSTGEKSHGGTYRGSGFSGQMQYQGQPGEAIVCPGYNDAKGHLQRAPIYPLKEGKTETPVKQGQLRGVPAQDSGFWIKVQDHPGFTNTEPLLGQVLSGLSILLKVKNLGPGYLKDVKFSDSGVVVVYADKNQQSVMVGAPGGDQLVEVFGSPGGDLSDAHSQRGGGASLS